MKRLPYYIAFINVVVLTTLVIQAGFTESVDRIMIRMTAKMSLILFLLAFSASALHQLLQSNWTATLVKYRRYVGLSFAMSHTFHLVFILLLQFYFDAQNFEERGFATVSGGAIAYVFMYLMAFTSTDHMFEKLGRRKWSLLHILGSYYIILVFGVSYIPRAIVDFNYLPYAILILIAVILRVIKVMSSR